MSIIYTGFKILFDITILFCYNNDAFVDIFKFY